ncbi:MAG TPA: DNA oxidative demethylase AlkB [Burkholderiaceae bacterium]|nr:DNA oxidative demethylase AlkB [Burkholderiaceae bacterium]
MRLPSVDAARLFLDPIRSFSPAVFAHAVGAKREGVKLGSDLFDLESRTIALAPGAMVLRNFAAADAVALLAGVADIEQCAPFRHLITPGGFRMSVAMTNCGAVGWVSDRTGYRYDREDPDTGLEWPSMPSTFRRAAVAAAAAAGFDRYEPDVCLINRYEPGARLSLHQDRNELDDEAPIVSVSLGLPAVFQFGGLKRSDRCARVPLEHGDVVVWGGPSRMRFHGVLPLAEGCHPELGRKRINLTFRTAR